VYNLTILTASNGQGYCYTWDESQRNRGGNEIATAVITWLNVKDEASNSHIILYSDTCGGPNRNKIMCTALILFIL